MSPIQTYLNTIAAHFAAGNATEHTYRPALQQLLNALLPSYHITNEPRRIACGAPDFVIAQGVEPIGHLEAKDIGVNLDKTQKSEQIARYLDSLNNLILTDYLEFRWFMEGNYKAELTVKLAAINNNGTFNVYPDAFSRFELLLKTFVETHILTLGSPEELAQKMAHIARLMNSVLLAAYKLEHDDGKLHQQLKSFREVLIDTLTPEEFADMVAQTICYGLFAAKCSIENQPFSAITAVQFIPKTNPFLRQFFNQLAGIDLDERLVWMVEHLVAVLNRADMSAILANFGKRTRQEDPVVHFYETFLANYDTKLREVRGVYYTPEPVVAYIVRSVDVILKHQFGLRDGLADSSKLNNSTTHKVQILDPATGTGTFLFAVIAKIYQRFAKNKGLWSDYVSQHLLPRVHGFELLMAAYTVAHIKLSLQLKNYGYDFKSEERLRVFLTNTLDEAHGKQTTIFAAWLSTEFNEASKIKRDSPVMVILGNPPYSGHSANYGAWINDLLRSAGDAANYFQVDGKALNERNPKWLNDDYVKFIRFAHWRIMQTGYGVLAFVTNHGYLDNPTFRGMRQALLHDFDEIYIVDLHGNAKKKETAVDGTADKNVFDIQQGVAIGIFIKCLAPTPTIAPTPTLPPKGEGANKPFPQREREQINPSPQREREQISPSTSGGRVEMGEELSPSTSGGRVGMGEEVNANTKKLPDWLLENARKLRKSSTNAEQLIWGVLRGKRFLNLKFRRQHPAQPYILDFYCHELKLGIEIDGGQHNVEQNRIKDEQRSLFLNQQGIKVLRFWNNEVLQQTDAVLEKLYWECVAVLSPHPNPPPKGEGANKPLPQREREQISPSPQKERELSPSTSGGRVGKGEELSPSPQREREQISPSPHPNPPPKGKRANKPFPPPQPSPKGRGS